MDIAEGQALCNFVIAHACPVDRVVDAHRGFTALMAVQAQVISFTFTESDHVTAGEGNFIINAHAT